MLNMNASRSLQNRHSGFTLLEVLIALLVLSFGLLGVAALQGVGLRSSHGAYLTSQASLLAYDMADRIRANPQGLDYHGFVTTSAACPAAVAAPLAAADMAEWACAVRGLLPNGKGNIEGALDPATGVISYMIEIEWEDLQAGPGGWNFVLAIDL
jgi:type IV pilus assembly protein PilV